MAVKARFWVQKVTKHATSKAQSAMVVELAPVIRSTGQPGAGENIDWSKFTPSGKIEMTITAEGAQEWFEAHFGEDVAITFDSIDEPE